MDELEEKLDYRFTDCQLLEKALTHNTYSQDNNERLEFLGDATLNFVMATVLYQHYSDMSEGEMSILMSNIVSQKALTSAAKAIDLEKYIRMSESPYGINLDMVLADTVEAIIAAVYLDGGLQAESRMIGKLLSETIENNRISFGKDAKSRLQEWLQARNLPLPTYHIVQIQATPDRYLARCHAHDKTGEGEGQNKQEAQKQAAKNVLSELAG